MVTTATDPSQIRFSKEDINENMFTKRMLWEAVVRQEKEIQTLKQESVKLEKAKKYIESINEHAETCSVFIYNDKGCNCFYKHKCEVLKEIGE